MRKPYFLMMLCSLLLAGVAFGQTSSIADDSLRFDVKNMDKSVDPCVDFYQYACGGWMATHPIPGDQARWGRFNQLAEHNLDVLHDILEKASQPNAKRDAVTQKIGDMYASCMDESTVDKLGDKPIQPLLERINSIKSQKDVITTIAYLHGNGIPTLFNMFPQPDMHDATKMVAMVDQGGLGLPDRDYYLKDDAKMVETRQKYLDHVQKMLELAGDKPEVAAAGAKKIMEIETTLAKASMDRAERRDPAKRDHTMSTKDLATLAPNFEFVSYFHDRELPQIDSLNVVNPDFFKQVNAVIASVSVEDWKTYLTWHVVKTTAPWLSKPFAEEDFLFQDQYLNGQKVMQARWKRCVHLVDRKMGEALGQPYVKETFGPDGKQRTLAMVDAIEKSMSADFNSLDWMSDTTKKQAQVKLNAIRNHIGYPDKWRDYSTVKIVRGDLMGDVLRADAFEEHRMLNKIGKPVDRDEWSMTPPTVNAYYRPSFNDINFPAGILQPPFFDKSMDDAVNFGGIGVVIGHELTHGFDDQGSQYDAQGNFKSWWTPEDRKEFDKRTQCVVDEYSGFVPVDDLHLNGRLTLGENTADNGGLRIALRALKSKNTDEKKIDGFTPEQRFFLGFAQIWCENSSPESKRVRVKIDPHSPGQFRVTGAVSNMPEFQQAFGCKAGQPMVRENACRVW